MDILAHLIEYDNDKEVWGSSRIILTRISAISLSTVVNSDLNKGMKTISECLQHVKTIADSLSAIDHKVSNPHLVTNTLSGLGPEYRQ